MSFESGSVGFRVFRMVAGLPADWAERLGAAALPAMEGLQDGVLQGWTTGRHMLDRAISQESATFGGFPRVALVQAERKIPEGLLRAECRMEELAHMKAEGAERISAAARREIRAGVVARLLPTAPPVLKGISVVVCEGPGLVFAGALSDRQADALVIHWASAMGSHLVAENPVSIALRMGVRVRDLPAVSFSRLAAAEETLAEEGANFLMWLWFLAETPALHAGAKAATGFLPLVEGPLRFCRSGELEVRVSKGEPLLARATAAALKAGMKLRSAKVTLARDDGTSFVFTLDALSFAVRGMKVFLPHAAAAESAAEMFARRMTGLVDFWGVLHGFYRLFLASRRAADGGSWPEESVYLWSELRPVKD